jgi:diguanylate cyclase (GGDEF)-like protein
MAQDNMISDDSRLRDLTLENESLSRALATAAKRIAELEKLAREDGLTGLLNRRSFDLELSRAIEFQARYGGDMALVLIDLDDFKSVNDRLGHAAGDALLRHVAALLLNEVRKSDVVGRIGGDEFALILWRLSPAAAKRKANTLRQRLAAFPTQFGDGHIDNPASVGCAPLVPGADAARWFRAADAALYEDKARGVAGAR